jgi:hypothetical protein
MAAGKPVVSTDVGGITEMIEHGKSGLLCSPGDDEGLAGALLRVIQNAGLRTRYAGQGHERVVSLFAIQRLISEWQEVYHKGLEDRRGLAIVPNRGAVDAHKQAAIDWPTSARRILVWRLCPFDDYATLIRGLRARYPNAIIDSLCQAPAIASVSPLLNGGRAIPYGNGSFSLARLGARTLELKNSGYDLAIVPYNAAGRTGYGQAETAAAWISPGRAFGVTPCVSVDALTSALRLGDAVRRSAINFSGGFASLGLLLHAVSRGLLRRPRREPATGASA